MFKFYKLQYQMKKITKEKLRKKVPRWITVEEYEIITGEPYEVASETIE